MSTSDWIASFSAIFSGIAVVVAVIARRDVRRAAEAAERSADVAARGERAWVAVQSVESSPDLRVEHIVLRAAVTLVNNGKTPACELRTWQKIELRTAPPSKADYPGTLAKGSKGVLGPSEPFQIEPALLEPTRGDFSEIVCHRSTVFLYGVAEYKDLIFNRCNRTSWCLHYAPESKEYIYSDCDNCVS